MDENEALVVCSDKSLGNGISIWDLKKGDQLLHIPTCASSPNGLVCLKNQHIVASQVQRPGSVGGGVIFTWPLNKPQAAERIYVMEVISSLASTKDGIYLAGGSTSGNIYVWEFHNCIWFDGRKYRCLVHDQAYNHKKLGSSLLAEDDSAHLPAAIYSWSAEHKAAITSLLSTSCKSFPNIISSSLDGTYNVWDMVGGKLIKAQHICSPITVAVLDTYESTLVCGCADGKIVVENFDIGLLEDPCTNATGEKVVLNGHLKSVTALTFSLSGLISASEDCTMCIWNIASGVIIQRLNHLKGPITNLVVVPKSSLLPPKNHQKSSNHFCVSSLGKYLKPSNLAEGTRIHLQPQCDEEGHSLFGSGYRTVALLNQHMTDIERERTPVGLQMKMETHTQNKKCASSMAKQTMKMNKRLQLSFLDLLQSRIIENLDAELPLNGTKEKR